MDTYTSAVAAKVRAELAARRRTQVEVSDATGIPITTLRRRLSGASAWSTDEIAAVAAFLGVRPSTLTDASPAAVVA